MLVSYTLALLVVIQAVVAQNATNSNNNTTAVQKQPTDKPAGLPNVEWDILRMDPGARENLCQRQIGYCSNNCGGPSEAPKNFCNSTSMAWGCGCKQKNPDFTPFLWPIVQAECSGKLQECQMKCNSEVNRSSTCATTCNAYYQCGTDKAPPSYLQTENPTDIPSYNGPPTAQNNANSDTGASDSTKTSSSSILSYNNYVILAAIFTNIFNYLTQ